MYSIKIQTELQIDMSDQLKKTIKELGDSKVTESVINQWEDFINQPEEIIEDINENYLMNNDIVKFTLKNKSKTYEEIGKNGDNNREYVWK